MSALHVLLKTFGVVFCFFTALIGICIIRALFMYHSPIADYCNPNEKDFVAETSLPIKRFAEAIKFRTVSRSSHDYEREELSKFINFIFTNENLETESSHILNSKEKEFDRESTDSISEKINFENNNFESELTHPLDIGLYINKQVSEEKKLELLLNAWQPDDTFKFPVLSYGKKRLKFQLNWLKKREWLLFSSFANGAFCKYCSLFPPSGAGVSKLPLGKLVREKYNDWKHALEDFNKHELTNYHNECKLKAQNFLDVHTQKKNSISIDIDKGLSTQIAKNRELLKPIIKTVIFCGRQGLSLRGHRDSGPLNTNFNVTDHENDGNFRAILRMRLDAGDSNLKNHLETCGRNASYISWSTQNEIISACGELIREKLVRRINSAKYFSILADETSDISGIEQMSLCIRYMECENLGMREDFYQFVPLSVMTGEGISQSILNVLTSSGLNINFLVGQGYDGASAMKGEFKGVQAYIKSKAPKALYVHCSSHSLNLAISDACSLSFVRNCIGTISKTYDFFNTPKRQIQLNKHVSDNSSKLKQMCPTRWIQRHDAVKVFSELYQPVLSALEEIADTWSDKDSASNAYILHTALFKFDFVISLSIISKMLSYSLPLAKYLQNENIDLRNAVEYAENVALVIGDVRANAEKEFAIIFEEAKALTEKLSIPLNIPRTAGRQNHRCNVEHTDAESYYRRAFFVPFVDNFISEINERFLSHKDVLSAFQVLLPYQSDIVFKDDDKKAVQCLCQTYFFDDDISEDAIYAEFKIWYKYLSKLNTRPKNALEAVKYCDSNLYPYVRKLLQIMATLPVTTCTAERSFSTLRYLKNYLRSTTSENRLNGLALLYIHRDIEISEEEILNKLSLKPRRLNFKI